MQSDYLIIGYGDIARRTARLLSSRGDTVSVVGRQIESDEATASTWTILQADLDLQKSLVVLPTSESRILYLAPPPESGQADSRMRNFCTALTQRLPESPAGIVYVSTSGVYGDCAGELVDESRPVNPQTDRARRRLDAETALQQWGALYRVPIVILRVAGIYGPGRLPLQRLQAGMPVLRPEQSPFSNRIHADDLARVCLAALDRAAAQGVFNVCDGEQSRMTDYFLAVARAFNLPEPEQIDRQEAQQRFSPEMLSYLAESRRLDNRRLLESLSIKLLYPTLAAGLRSLFEPLTTGAQED
jgi:nucleoside-diphosphate-sugar epimerase